MNAIYKAIVSAMCIGTILCACQGSEPQAEDGNKFKPIELTETQTSVVSAQNDFAVRVFSKISETDKRPNQIFSPLSLSINLSMLSNGLNGETRQQVLDALGVSNGEMSVANELCATLLATLPEQDQKTSVKFANAICTKDDNQTLPSFADVCKNVFRVEIFGSLQDALMASGLLNNWAYKSTDGLVKEIVNEDELKGQDIILASAVTFHGQWAEKFDKTKTKTETFHNADGTTSNVPMMNGETLASVVKDNDCEIANIRYGNGAYSLIIIKPNEGKGVDECIAKLTPEYRAIVAKYTKGNEHHSYVKMPRVKINNTIQLKDILVSMGVKDIFSASGDFSEMFERAVKIDKIKQVSTIEINEEGSEAAAVTVTGGYTMSAASGITLDRPYLFYITERSTGSILFMGKVTQL